MKGREGRTNQESHFLIYKSVRNNAQQQLHCNASAAANHKIQSCMGAQEAGILNDKGQAMLHGVEHPVSPMLFTCTAHMLLHNEIQDLATAFSGQLDKPLRQSSLLKNTNQFTKIGR